MPIAHQWPMLMPIWPKNWGINGPPKVSSIPNLILIFTVIFTSYIAKLDIFWYNCKISSQYTIYIVKWKIRIKRFNQGQELWSNIKLQK